MPAVVAAVVGAAAPPEATAAEVNGYLEARAQFSRARVGGLVPTDDLPQLGTLFEANVQTKAVYAERGFVLGDLSLFLQATGSLRGTGPGGEEVVLAPRHIPAADPLVVLQELYLSHDLRPELNLLVGKKRVVWGPGMANNPTDLINPPKDPTDPSFQRAGAYMVRAEVPLERAAFTLLASPAVLRNVSGLPAQFLVHPSWDEQDRALHYMLAGRAYFLVADSDLNLMAFFGNRFGDAFENKPRLGASFSRVFGALELHFEGLFQQGSSRGYPTSACLRSLEAPFACTQAGTPIVSTARLLDREVLPRLLAGGRYHFADESMLSVEYLYQGDGFTAAQFQDYVSALTFFGELRRRGGSAALPGPGGTQGTPLRFSFEPLRRHYAFVTFQKPRIREDFTFQATLIANLQDLSTLWSPMVQWSATEWLTLSLSGFVPVRGPRALAAVRPDGGVVTEYSLIPMQYRAVFQARVFY